MKVDSISNYKPSYLQNNAARMNKIVWADDVEFKKSDNITPPSNAYSHISFTGTEKKSLDDYKKMHEIEKSFTPEADRLYKNAKGIAIKTGAKELEPHHTYAAVLLSAKKYINDLDSGIANYNEQTGAALPSMIEDVVYPESHILADDNTRTKVKEVLDKHIDITKKEFIGKQQKTYGPAHGVSASKTLIHDLSSTYNTAFAATQNTEFYDNYFLTAAAMSQDRKLAKEVNSLVFDLQSAVMVNNNVKKEKNHLKFYDDKADAIWKNVNIGNDVISLYDSNDATSSKHLVSSFVNLINKPGQQYKNIKPEDTEIISLKDSATFEYLGNLSKSIKNDPSKKGKTSVIVADLTHLLKNSGGQLTMEDLNTLKNAPAAKGGDVRYVYTLNKEVYYANMQKGGVLAPILSDYAVQTLPSLNAADAKKYLTDENGVKFIERLTGKVFTPETIQKSIEITSSDEGNYPDKALELLGETSKYFVDKKDITPENIEQYITETKDLSEAQSGNRSNIVFDTGKRLSDIVGSPMTKADAETIVNQIKNGTLGTKGFTAYLDNGSSYGGGRRHTAEAIAGEAGIPMITINAKDFALKDIDALSQNADLSELKIKNLVSTAKAQAEANENKTAMIYIENFDNFASNPLYGISSIYEQKAFSQLLAEMDSARENNNINLLVVGSVNNPDYLDPNVLKPSRFINSIVVFPPQDSDEREEIIKYHINKMGLEIAGDTPEETEKIIKDISETTYGFTPVDIMYMLETAKSVSIERGKDKIDASDMTEAYLQVTTGRVNQSYMPESKKNIVASHEAGHALVLQLMYEMAEKQQIPWHLSDKVNFITLDPRGNYGGAMFHKPSKNQEYSFEKIFSDLCCSYGGHSAENVIYNMSGSYGITGDMQSVAGLARAAVLDMGMGPRTGVCHIPRNGLGAPDVSEAKKMKIEQDIDSFQNSAKKVSDMIVTAYKDFILEFTEKYSDRVGTGDCVIPAETFRKELNEWRNNLPEDKKQELENLENDVLEIIEQTKNGEI